MPRIPESSAIRMPRAAVPSGRVELIGQRTIQRTVDQLFHLGAQYKQQQQQGELAKLSGEMERSLTTLRLEIEQNPEINTAEDASRLYTERAKIIVEGAVGQGKWKAVKTALTVRGASTSLRGVAAVSRVGYEREVDASRATLFENTETYINSYATAEDEIGQASAISKFEVELEMNTYVGEEEKAKLRSAFGEGRVKQRTIHLTNQGRFGEARQFLQSEDATSVLEPTDVRSLTRTIDTAETHLETQRRKAQTAADEATTHRILERILDPAPGAPLPTVSEILDANLSRVETEHFVDLITSKARGEDVDYLDANVVNELYTAVRSGRITTFGELSPWIGNGAPIEEVEKMMGIIAARERNPSQKALDKRVEQFLTGYKAPISGSTMMGIADPMGGPNFFAFRVDVYRRIEEAIKKGEDPYRLLTPGTKEFLGPLHTNFKRSQREIMESQLEAVGAEFGGAEEVPATPPTNTFEQFVEEQGK